MSPRMFARDMANRHSFTDEQAPNECGCWDCAAMAARESLAECVPCCVVCHNPNAELLWCDDCDACTWQDAEVCLSCGHTPEYYNPQGDVPWGCDL